MLADKCPFAQRHSRSRRCFRASLPDASMAGEALFIRVPVPVETVAVEHGHASRCEREHPWYCTGVRVSEKASPHFVRLAGGQGPEAAAMRTNASGQGGSHPQTGSPHPICDRNTTPVVGLDCSGGGDKVGVSLVNRREMETGALSLTFVAALSRFDSADVEPALCCYRATFQPATLVRNGTA